MIQDKQRFPAFSSVPLSVLDEQGNWTADFGCDLETDLLVELYTKMLGARLMDERFLRLQRMGKMSFTAPLAGHEGAQIAAAAALIPGKDWYFPYYRDYGATYALGVPLNEIFAQVMGAKSDPAKSRQMPMHPSSKTLNIFTTVSAIAAHIPPAVGAALSMKFRNTGEVALTSFGDGATSEGDFHAALNFAGVQGAPVVFLCENNRYAISVGFEQQSGSSTVAEKAHAYGMPGYLVDGMDVLACYYVLREAVAQARNGLGPSLIDAQVYRYGPHSSADDDSHYREQTEKDTWAKRDPLKRLRTYLSGRGLWSDEQDAELKDELNQSFTDAIRTAEEAGKAPVEWMLEDVFEEMPPHLVEQKEYL